jgi:hypothetical protein
LLICLKHYTEKVSESALQLKEYIFQPLANLNPDIQQILLKDFIELFEDDSKLTSKKIENGILPYKQEFERCFEKLKLRILDSYTSVFGRDQSPDEALLRWFSGLSKDKQNYTYNGEAAVLINACRKNNEINKEDLFKIANDLSGLDIESWGDELVLIFQGKLDAAKNHVDTFTPPSTSGSCSDFPVLGFDPDQARLSVFSQGKTRERIFDINKEISSNGQVLENMLNSIIEQLGKGMDEKEKIMILYRIIEKHIFGLIS